MQLPFDEYAADPRSVVRQESPLRTLFGVLSTISSIVIFSVDGA